MDRKTVKAIAAEAEQALQKVAKKHGLTVASAGGKFGVHNATLKFEFGETTENGTSAKADADWNLFRGRYGLDKVELGAYFIVGGTRYKIHSCKPRSPKWPIVGEGPRGGLYKFQAAQVKNGLV